MDINQLFTAEAHEEGAEIRIKSPLDGAETDFYITLQGIDSKTYRKAVRKYHRALLNEEEGGEIDLLVSITKDWRGLSDGKNDVPFSAEKAKELYTNAPSVTAQMDSFVADRKNFIKGWLKNLVDMLSGNFGHEALTKALKSVVLIILIKLPSLLVKNPKN